MPRRSLDPTTTGETAKMEVRVPQELIDKVDEALKDGETRSEFVRQAMQQLCKRRERSRKNTR